MEGDSLEREISTKAWRLNSVSMNWRFEKNSLEKEEKKDVSRCLHVRRKWPYSGVERWEATVSSTSRGSVNNPLLLLDGVPSAVMADAVLSAVMVVTVCGRTSCTHA